MTGIRRMKWILGGHPYTNCDASAGATRCSDTSVAPYPKSAAPLEPAPVSSAGSGKFSGEITDERLAHRSRRAEPFVQR